MSPNMARSFLRSAKNFTMGYSDAQIRVRKATCSDPWGPSLSLMSEIAALTHNGRDFLEIMEMLDKRLNDSGKNWRHVYKSLILLEYLIQHGSSSVRNYAKENLYIIKTLKEFQYIDDEGRDQGANVRQKCRDVLRLLLGEEGAGNPSAENSRPSSIQNAEGGTGHEDEDMRRAIEASKRTAAEEERRRLEREQGDPEFQKALEVSERDAIARETNARNQQSDMIDFFAPIEDEQQRPVHPSPSAEQEYFQQQAFLAHQQELQRHQESYMLQQQQYLLHQQQQQQLLVQEQELMRQQQVAAAAAAAAATYSAHNPFLNPPPASAANISSTGVISVKSSGKLGDATGSTIDPFATISSSFAMQRAPMSSVMGNSTPAMANSAIFGGSTQNMSAMPSSNNISPPRNPFTPSSVSGANVFGHNSAMGSQMSVSGSGMQSSGWPDAPANPSASLAYNGGPGAMSASMSNVAPSSFFGQQSVVSNPSYLQATTAYVPSPMPPQPSSSPFPNSGMGQQPFGTGFPPSNGPPPAPNPFGHSF